MSKVRRTEADGLQAVWRLDYPHRITVLAVHNTADDSALVTFGPAGRPDLAQARELLPEFETLWDTVRHEFWSELCLPKCPSATRQDTPSSEHHSPSAHRHADELPSIRPWVLAIEDKAGPGYLVEREPNPPYGWNLFDQAGVIVCSGSLDRLELWVLRQSTRSVE
ncbi:hypothetical protein [Nocardia terpenica]|uniref:hypothetical protein n=1 Tax=Nocardia terpenica TaxID=455432 RepID=UPI0012FD987B|nr:hypothetical protein [Nocardia terpenica]